MTLNLPRRAFSTLELVVVVAIVGILATFVASKFRDDPLARATLQIASHLRYTQAIALNDDRFSTRTDWHESRPIFEFTHINTQKKIKNVCENVTCWRYNVYKDTSGSTNLNAITQAVPDPLNPAKRLTAGFSPGSLFESNIKQLNLKLNLTYTFGVTDVEFSGGCKAQRAGVGVKFRFDELGRVYTQNPTRAYNGAVSKRCEVRLFDKNGACKMLTIEAQTGFVMANLKCVRKAES